MYCSTSITMHLLRGIGALILIVIAFLVAPTHPSILLPTLLGAVLLLRGCPMCWIMGLIEKTAGKRSNALSDKVK